MSNDFAYIRFPNESKIQFFNSEKKENKIDPFLLIQTFDEKIPPVKLFPSLDNSNFFSSINLNSSNLKSSIKEVFHDKVRDVISRIRNKEFQKLVVSRVKVIPLPINFNAINFYHTLNENYKNTFNSLFYYKNALWIGASPELLLKSSNNKIHLMSLAGTIKNTDNSIFTAKEFEEQNYVTHYIKEILNNYCVPDTIHIASQKTLNFGAIKHILNEISGNLNTIESLYPLLQALHPTPAVAGIPKIEAQNYIKNHENYRDQYTGYIGVFNKDQCECYVNLRCMQVFKNQIILYAGCGITADSDPELEWLETEYKIDALLKFID